MFSKVHLCLPVIVLEIFFICVQSYDFPESPYFSRYDGLDYSPDSFSHPHKRTRRSTSKTNLLLPINAFGKSFQLVLSPDYEVVHPNAKLIVGGREWTGGLSAVSDHVVRGYVDGFTLSVVFGSVIDGVFRGTVSLNKSNLLHSAPGSYDTYFIEPSGYYFNKDFPFHSVIYNSLDVKIPTVGQSRMRRAVQEMDFKFCGLSYPNIAQKMSKTSCIDDRKKHGTTVLRNRESYFLELQSPFVRSFKSPHLVNNNALLYEDKGPNTRVCNLYLQSDTYLWDHVINKRHIQGNRELAVKEITSIFTQHVQAAQLIYQDAVFRDHSVATKVSQLTFAHELGHNFGAKHDNFHENESYGCLPSIDDVRGNYIMFASAISGDKENNNKFSSCSLDSIAKLLDRVLRGEKNCFLTSDGPFCGNQLTEEGEECDCGFTRVNCHDKCCHPRDSASPCKLVNSVFIDHVQRTVQCSPTAGVCCTENCQYRPETHMCRPAGECHRSSNCSGRMSKCPPVDILPDGTLCQDGTRVCKQGQCIGSICERIPGWHECSFTRDKKVVPELMCFVGCKQNISGAPCISSFQLEKELDVRAKYPQVAVELLRNGRGIKLPPGAPCDNYRGYCDVSMRCLLVDAEGPLSRLRNLVFSPQMLQKIKTWITIHWWAVMLIALTVIIGAITFVKMCAFNTPPVRLHNVNRTMPNLTPFLTSSHIPSGSVDQPVVWTVTSHPVKLSGSPNPPRTNRLSRSSRRQSRKSKDIKGVIRYPITSEKKFITPSVAIHPLDFPPSNARQTPLPVLHPNPLSAVDLPLQPIPCNSRNPSDIEPVGANSNDSNTEFLQQNDFYQRPNSVLIPSTAKESNVRKPKIPSKLSNEKRKRMTRPVSECTVGSNVSVPEISIRVDRLNEENEIAIPQPDNRVSGSQYPRNDYHSISPPSYDDLMQPNK
ncbi:unnamed protein product [Schistosoma spindalis]|nr:unnamed protein product [Schistosoma spindale]